MKCSCPKCSSDVNIDDPAIPEKGSFSHCPDCNSRFWLHREPFLLRAYKKDWKAFCHHCGGEVGSASHCQSCFKPFPDYWVVQASKPVRRKSTYKADISISLPGFSFKKSKTVEKLVDKPKIESEEFFDVEPENKVAMPRKPIMVFGVVVLLVVGLFLGGKELLKGNEQYELFSRDYIRTLYSVTAGADINLELLNNLASGKPISSDETQQLQKMKLNMENHLQKISSPPADFAGPVTDLNNVYQAYVELHNLAVKTSVVTADFQSQLDNLSARLDQAEQKLKRDLPSDLREEIIKVTNKYHSLKFIEG